MVAGRRYRLNLNRATQLVNAPAAWNAFGGIQNAGAGIKIAMLDTGIDQTHPAFQDSSLQAAARVSNLQDRLSERRRSRDSELRRRSPTIR